MMDTDKIILGDLERDGGSAFMRVVLGGREYDIRVMRSFGEQKSEMFGSFEITDKTGSWVVEKISDIEGLSELLAAPCTHISDSVREIFLNPRKI